MGLFDKPREEKARRREYAKQELMALSEKELLVEILLELKELNEQSEKIKRNQVIWSNYPPQGLPHGNSFSFPFSPSTHRISLRRSAPYCDCQGGYKCFRSCR